MILTTKNHQRDAQILIDADLAILTSNLDDYRQYTQAIRQEYFAADKSNNCTK